ncbi:MAG: hypothetical protein J7M12_01245 [Candidatus Hydrogenedentes bacterium]|nr:hypothetical protein [Candidatus Hydrogenedentota bacterium]
MTTLDVFFIVLYFVIVLGLGFWYSKQAARNLESYFLGGKSIHWLPLAMSGSVSNFDITGTMWIVSMIYVLGIKAMWHQWMWGFLMGAFFMAYMGTWVRRSNVMTAAEWMKTRFGDDTGGRMARTAYAVMAVVTQAGFIGYAYQGIGKFAAVYIPLENLAPHVHAHWLQQLFTVYEPHVLAVTIISVTTLYVVMGGLYSVVITDVIQTVILTVGSVFIAWIAWSKMTPELINGLPDGFASLSVHWRLPQFAGTENAQFEFFGGLVIVWVVKGLLLNAGGPGQMYDFQRFLAARNPTDAAKVGSAWSAFLVVRWAMAMGIALLAITGVTGVTDSEQVMPLVLRDYLPAGIRGIVLAGLLAAFMSTFSSTVNSGASFIVRDIWQPYFGRNADDRAAVKCSYLATVFIVALGIIIGFEGESIAQIWGWLMMALGGGVIVPNVLRWYWWRLNGWGFACGTFAGMAMALLSLLVPDAPVYYVFPAIVAVSFVTCLTFSYLTRPVSANVLKTFYETVRPFGLWQPVRVASRISTDQTGTKPDRVLLVATNVILAMIAIFAGYVAPMYLVGHFYVYAAIWFGICLSMVVILKFTWYNNLPDSHTWPRPNIH